MCDNVSTKFIIYTMIQKKNNMAEEWHMMSTAAVEKISKYIAAHGISEELRETIKGRRVGKVVCDFSGKKVRVVTKSRSSERRRTLDMARARAAKEYMLLAV